MVDQKWLPKRSKPSSKSLMKRNTKGNTKCKRMKCHSGSRKMEVIQGVWKIVCIPMKGGKI